MERHGPRNRTEAVLKRVNNDVEGCVEKEYQGKLAEIVAERNLVKPSLNKGMAKVRIPMVFCGPYRGVAYHNGRI